MSNSHRIDRLVLDELHPDAASLRRQQDEALQASQGVGRTTRVLQQKGLLITVTKRCSDINISKTLET